MYHRKLPNIAGDLFFVAVLHMQAAGAALATGIVMAYFAFFHGNILAGIFSNQPDVIYAAADYLRAYAIDTLIVSFLFCYIGYFNGCGKTNFVMVQGIVGAFLVRIPVSYFAHYFIYTLLSLQQSKQFNKWHSSEDL